MTSRCSTHQSLQTPDMLLISNDVSTQQNKCESARVCTFKRTQQDAILNGKLVCSIFLHECFNSFTNCLTHFAGCLISPLIGQTTSVLIIGSLHRPTEVNKGQTFINMLVYSTQRHTHILLQGPLSLMVEAGKY